MAWLGIFVQPIKADIIVLSSPLNKGVTLYLYLYLCSIISKKLKLYKCEH